MLPVWEQRIGERSDLRGRFTTADRRWVRQTVLVRDCGNSAGMSRISPIPRASSSRRLALDHIRAGEQPLMHEGCLEQGGGRVLLKDPARLRQRIGDMPMIVRHEVSARETLAG